MQIQQNIMPLYDRMKAAGVDMSWYDRAKARKIKSQKIVDKYKDEAHTEGVKEDNDNEPRSGNSNQPIKST